MPSVKRAGTSKATKSSKPTKSSPSRASQAGKKTKLSSSPAGTKTKTSMKGTAPKQEPSGASGGGSGGFGETRTMRKKAIPLQPPVSRAQRLPIEPKEQKGLMGAALSEPAKKTKPAYKRRTKTTTTPATPDVLRGNYTEPDDYFVKRRGKNVTGNVKGRALPSLPDSTSDRLRNPYEPKGKVDTGGGFFIYIAPDGSIPERDSAIQRKAKRKNWQSG